jgi:hypothetical protein
MDINKQKGACCNVYKPLVMKYSVSLGNQSIETISSRTLVIKDLRVKNTGKFDFWS